MLFGDIWCFKVAYRDYSGEIIWQAIFIFQEGGIACGVSSLRTGSPVFDINSGSMGGSSVLKHLFLNIEAEVGDIAILGNVVLAFDRSFPASFSACSVLNLTKSSKL